METTNHNYIVERALSLQQDLKQYAYSLTVNRDDAEDLLQDTFFKGDAVQ